MQKQTSRLNGYKKTCSCPKYKKKTYENYVDGVLDKEEYLLIRQNMKSR